MGNEIEKLQQSNDGYREKAYSSKKDYEKLQKNNSRLRDELKNMGNEFINLNQYIEQLTLLQKNYIELENSKSRLRKEKKILEKHQLKPFKKGDNRNRGGCKLTDLEIERLLMIFAKRGRYAHMSLTQAIKEVSQTHQTYYRVIKRDYSSHETKLRIENLALKLNIELPERGKLK